ncbi:MAG: SCO family protein, partial [Anaerolineae bacterium]|nr:SCO family protein [Anaerolineae bacterium]
MKRVIQMSLAGLFFSLLLAGCQPYQYTGAVLEPPKEIADFTLPATSGDTFTLSDYQGKLVLLYFGYTYCPDVCPATLFQIRQAYEALGDQAEDVQVVMITVDPQRDTPEQFGRYIANIHPSFVGLSTTDEALLQQIAADFGVYFELEPPDPETGGYVVNHTASVFLIDRQSRMLEVFMYGT